MNLFTPTHDGNNWRKTPVPRHHSELDDYEPVPASWPTKARPGTLEKLMVLAERVERGEELFSPQDVRL
jgi:hypothetical protein